MLSRVKSVAAGNGLQEHASAARPDVAPAAGAAWEDLKRGLRRPELFGRLGWLEIKRRYRRTVIGPFWSTFSLAVFVLALGTVGGGLWKQSEPDYMPFLAAGMVVWMMVASNLNESCSLFSSNQNLFRQMRFDYSILVYALIWRNFIVFLHNLIVYAVIMLVLGRHLFNMNFVLVVPGLALVLLNCAWLALLLSLVCLRFRDLQQLVASLVQISMFITPVFWPPNSLSGLKYAIFVTINPLYHLIDVARSPLLGRAPALGSYFYMIAMTACGWAFAYFMFRYFRKRIAYWS